MNKIINVTRSSMPGFDEYVKEIEDIWQTHCLTNMGVKHEELKAKLRKYLKVEELDLFTNGHMSIEIALQALQLNGEIITTPFTFVSTTNAIIRSGCTPVFCDIDPIDFTIDVNRIEELITDKTVAILPVHVYGNICDVSRIQSIAEKHNLKVVYDAAHAFGVQYNDFGVGFFGDASCFSFHATKVFNSIEGGAICFNNSEFGSKIARLKNFGIKSQEEVVEVGVNAKMNEFCAAMGLCNLVHIDEEIEKRKNVANCYDDRLKDIDGIQLKNMQLGVKQNYAYYPVVFDETKFGKTRDDIIAKLAENNIFARKYFYPLVSSFECYRDFFDKDRTPVAQQVSRRVLTLPVYSDLSIDEVNEICDLIVKK